MKVRYAFLSMAALVCLPVVYAKTPKHTPYLLQPVTVLRVNSGTKVQPAYSGGDNPSDAPLQSEVYCYEVGIRADCSKLVTRYQSPFDYFPSAFSPNAEIPARVAKHEVVFELPSGREMKMPIVSRKRIASAGCEVQR
jgi:hypothetical protein